MKRIIKIGVPLCFAVWSLGPFVWMWATALKSPAMVSQLPPVWPASLNLENFASVLDNPLFLQVILNSLLVSFGATGLGLIVGTVAAFGVSRLMKSGKGRVLFALLVIFMIPQVALVTPLFKFMGALHWKDTLTGLILVYSVFTIPLVVWIMHQVFEEVPDSLYYAAQVDGCSNWKIFYKVFLPLGRHGWISAGLLSFLFCWNEFLFALTFTSTYAARTIPVGISMFTGQFEFPWGEISAATSIVTFPIIAIVVFAQKHLTRGLAGSGIKG